MTKHTPEYMRAYREKNRERIREYERAWRAANPNKTAAKGKRWYDKNAERKRAASRAWKAANPDKVAAWYDPDRKREVARAWRAQNPGLDAEYKRRRRALMRNADFAPFTFAQLQERMAYWGERCWMCRGPFEQVDHVKPVSKGGAHVLANMRPSCADCNSKKRARWYGVAGLNRFRVT